jgi:hypothetical protein
MMTPFRHLKMAGVQRTPTLEGLITLEAATHAKTGGQMA